MVIKWTDPAKQDLKSIHDYVSRDSRYYAKKMSFEIINKSEKLKDFPKIGRIVPEIEDKNIREIIIYSYRLIYEIHENKVEILALVHCKRKFLKSLID